MLSQVSGAMLEFVDPTTGVITGLLAIALRMLEAVWKEVRKRSKRAYRLKRDLQASDAQTMQAGVSRYADLNFESDNRRYSITQIPRRRQ